MFLPILVDSLLSRDLITEREAKEIKTLYNLERVLEFKNLDRLLPPEREYLSAVRDVIKKGNLFLLENLFPPNSLESFHESLLIAGRALA